MPDAPASHPVTETSGHQQFQPDATGAPHRRHWARAAVARILASAAIEIDGSRPWDIHVHHPHFFRRVLLHGSIGLGESYMDGWWDVEALDEFFARVTRADLYKHTPSSAELRLAFAARLLNRQAPAHSKTVARQHYDLGTDLYRAMLDRNMQYTCAYWDGSATLEQAQEKKLELICRKLYLRPGMTVLELGSGFGGLARYMAERFGCRVVAYNISHAQTAFARQWCASLPIRFEEKDYRAAIDEPQQFDRVVSIGLCEHVGHKNYRAFLELAHNSLRDGGLFLLHSIGGNASFTVTDAWIDKYIFPDGMIPSIAQLGYAIEGLWIMEDWHNFGPDYDRTLLEWWKNFHNAWPALRPSYGDRFYRMWRYYLMASAGAFRSRKLQLWQIVLSKGDIPVYKSVR
jgi:cyclopropane-fatty-acyl-phospholipid synthase